MTINNKLLCCMLFICFLSFLCSINAEDHNHEVTEQIKITHAPSPVINYPPPPNHHSITSEASTTRDEDLATYCVAKSFGANMEYMASALSWTCGVVDCSVLQPGNLCFEPNSLPAHASYAFNLYYQKNNRISGSCDFNGTAMITNTNPSHGTCMFTDHNPGFSRSSVSRLRCGSILAFVLFLGGALGL